MRKTRPSSGRGVFKESTNLSDALLFGSPFRHSFAFFFEVEGHTRRRWVEGLRLVLQSAFHVSRHSLADARVVRRTGQRQASKMFHRPPHLWSFQTTWFAWTVDRSRLVRFSTRQPHFSYLAMTRTHGEIKFQLLDFRKFHETSGNLKPHAWNIVLCLLCYVSFLKLITYISCTTSILNK